MDKNTSLTLVFVYNAQSGLLNMLKDAVHKTFAPKTYPCKLCDITYSPVRMRSQWKIFVESLPFPVEFSYIDLIEEQYSLSKVDYPSAWIKRGSNLVPWLGSDQIDQCENLNQLQELVLTHLPDTDS